MAEMRLVDAVALKKTLEDAGLGEHSLIESVLAAGVYAVIDNAPTIDAVPVVHAFWRHIGGDEWCCTDCALVISTEGSWEKPWQAFCPNCGAKMDGGEA